MKYHTSKLHLSLNKLLDNMRLDILGLVWFGLISYQSITADARDNLTKPQRF